MKILLFILFAFVTELAYSQDTTIRIIVYKFDINSETLTSHDGEIIANSLRNSLARQSKNLPIKVLEEEASTTKLIEDAKDVIDLSLMYDTITALKLGKLMGQNYAVIGNLATSNLFSGIMVSIKMIDIEHGVILTANEYRISDYTYDSVILVATYDIIAATQKDAYEFVSPINIDIEYTDSSIFQKYHNYRSFRIEDVLKRYQFLIPVLYVRPKIPKENFINALNIINTGVKYVTGGYKQSTDTEIIGLIECGYAENHFSIVFCEDQIFWRTGSYDQAQLSYKTLKQALIKFTSESISVSNSYIYFHRWLFHKDYNYNNIYEDCVEKEVLTAMLKDIVNILK